MALTEATPQVVLQIERMSQSSLLKHYEEKNAALRRELKAQGASMDRSVSEIDAIRCLLHEARAEIVQHKQEQAQLLAIQRRLQGHLQMMQKGMQMLTDKRFGVLVCDEAHRVCRRPDSARHAIWHDLRRGARGGRAHA